MGLVLPKGRLLKRRLSGLVLAKARLVALATYLPKGYLVAAATYLRFAPVQRLGLSERSRRDGREKAQKTQRALNVRAGVHRGGRRQREVNEGLKVKGLPISAPSPQG
jgi:hypothetical protein